MYINFLHDIENDKDWYKKMRPILEKVSKEDFFIDFDGVGDSFNEATLRNFFFVLFIKAEHLLGQVKMANIQNERLRQVLYSFPHVGEIITEIEQS